MLKASGEDFDDDGAEKDAKLVFGNDANEIAIVSAWSSRPNDSS